MVLMSTAAVSIWLATWRRPSTSTSVRLGPSPRRSRRLSPAWPIAPSACALPAVRVPSSELVSAGTRSRKLVTLVSPERWMLAAGGVEADYRVALGIGGPRDARAGDDDIGGG